MSQSQPISRGSMTTPIGELLIFSFARRVIAIEFTDRGHAEARIRRFIPGARFIDAPVPDDVRNALRSYFDSGCCDALDELSIEPFGTAFQLAVWNELRKIPAGAISSYGAIAKAIGRSGASRAVGAANGQNPIPIVIPCHRVIGTDRSLTGYGSGLDRKAWLLAREGVDLDRKPHSNQEEFPYVIVK